MLLDNSPSFAVVAPSCRCMTVVPEKRSIETVVAGAAELAGDYGQS
jgi:hypothetical protein